MRYGSVCSGIEAASVAWDSLGWKASFLSEIEAFPRAVLAHRFPSVSLHGDFTTIKSGDYDPIDLLVGGTPCQAFSVAGLRGGLEDERGNLALEFIRLTKRLGPRFVLWENVPGVLSSNGGRDFGSILGALVQLGYGVAYRVLDAQYFGVPQRRRRVFVVGCLGDDGTLASKILFDGDGMCRHSHKSKKTGKDVANCLTARFGSGRNDPTAETYIPSIANTLKAYSGGNQIEQTYIPCNDLNSQSGDHRSPGADADTCESLISVVQSVLTAKDNHLRNSSISDSFSNPLAFDTYNQTLNAENFHTLRTGIGDAVPSVIIPFDTTQITSAANRSNPQPGDLCHTLGAQSHPPAIATQLAVRRLTPRECERLQGFSDDWTLVPIRGKDAADGPRYKAIGNSMAVPVMRWIGERIAHYSTEASE